MLNLALPLVLANLTMALISATDVLLLGRLGAHQLAAATLALNLTVPFMFFLLGLTMASSPLMASALGGRRRSLRDVRQTVRQTLWVIVTTAIPCWLLLWNAEPIVRLLG